MPTVWPLQCPTGVHEDHEARHGNSEGAWDTLRDFHRRHPPDGILTAEYREHPEGNDLPAGAPAFLNKQREVHSHTLPEDQLPGLCDRLPEDDNQPTGGEAEKDTGGMPGCPETGEGHSEGSVENDRKDDCSSASSPPSPTSLQSSPILEELCIPPLPVVRNPGSPQPRSPEGSSMVDRGGEALERQVPEGNTPRPVNRDGCLPPRMGRIGTCLKATPPDLSIETDASLLGWGASAQGESTGGLWSTQERQSHINVLELQGGAFALRSLVRESHLHIRLMMDNTTAISYINHMGGTRSKSLAQHAVELWQWCLDRGLTVSAEHLAPRSEQRHSRQGHSSSEWKLNPAVFRSIANMHSGPMYGGPICHTVEHLIDQVHELEARPFRHGNRCPEGPMEAVAGICLPSVCPDREMPAQDQAGTSSNSADSPSLAHTSVVFSSPRITSPDPNSPTIPPGPPQGSIQSDPPTSARRQPSTGRMESVAEQRGFRKKLLSSFQQAGAGALTQHTNQAGPSGTAGAYKGIVIPFHVAQPHW